MKYYATERPIMPGAIPRGKIEQVVNFDEKTYCEEIGEKAWGFVEYLEELTESQVADYELVPEGTRKYYNVLHVKDENGEIVVKSVEPLSLKEKPENTSKTTRSGIVCKLWFDSEEEAEAYVSENI